MKTEPALPSDQRPDLDQEAIKERCERFHELSCRAVSLMLESRQPDVQLDDEIEELIHDLAVDAPRLLAEIERLRAEPSHGSPAWQPISTAPHCDNLLVVSGSHVFVASFIPDSDPDIRGWYFQGTPNSSDDWPDPTHWMPLPVAPPLASAPANSQEK